MSEPTTLREALASVDAAAPALFAGDPTVRAVGVERRPDGGYGLVATRCGDVIQPYAAAVPSAATVVTLPASVAGLPLRQRPTTRAPAVLARLSVQLGRSSGTSPVPERVPLRPLPWGAELQNFDADQRSGLLPTGGAFVGTLGCVVRLYDGTAALLSNNHVLADENHGRPGHDRVLQSASPHYAPAHQVARLGPFVPIVPWHGPGTLPPQRALNTVDAGISWHQGYLPEHGLRSAHATGLALLGDHVHKVGRTTRGTVGVVTQMGITLGPIAYRDGPSYFQRIFAVETPDGQPFARPGDSGSAIVRDDGALVGLLFAGDDQVTYACDAEHVFTALGCTLA